MISADTAFPRIDILLYAHDGRGLGHISRSVAIGLALRRLYPELRVLLVTGGAQSQELIVGAPLDWLKLPAYRTEVVDGKSRGIEGNSGFKDHDLGVIRAEHIRHIISLYRPRLVLADHSPQGKHRELLPALQENKATGSTRWVLGMRGVIGQVKQTSSQLAVDLFRDNYSALLWYGDSSVLGTSHCRNLGDQFSTSAIECGYVSRLLEMEYRKSQRDNPTHYACTISVPWAGKQTEQFLELLADFLKRKRRENEIYRFFLGEGISANTKGLCEAIGNARVESFNSGYLDSLLKSKTAIIYGGYNSLIDIVSAKIPALVVLRNMKDQEQQLHVSAVQQRLHDIILTIDEKECIHSPSNFHSQLSTLFMKQNGFEPSTINLSGAATAARHLAAALD